MEAVAVDVSGSVTHAVSHSGKITYGSPTRGGEVYFTFDPGGTFESEKPRADLSMKLLEYAKWRYNNPAEDSTHFVSVQSGGAGAKIGEKK